MIQFCDDTTGNLTGYGVDVTVLDECTGAVTTTITYINVAGTSLGTTLPAGWTFCGSTGGGGGGGSFDIIGSAGGSVTQTIDAGNTLNLNGSGIATVTTSATDTATFGVAVNDVKDTVGPMLNGAGFNYNSTTKVYDAVGSVGQVLTITGSGTAAFQTLVGGGGSQLWLHSAVVYRTATNTVAVKADGTTISTLATTSANNVTVIQAAIDAVAGTETVTGTNTIGYSGGGVVAFGPSLFDLNASLTLKFGVSLLGYGTLDRAGAASIGNSFVGTTFRATSALTGAILNVGTSQAGNGIRSATNPHGTKIVGINFSGYGATGNHYGILNRDTSILTIDNCQFSGFNTSTCAAFKVLSTNSPDEGAFGMEVHNSYFAGNNIHIQVSGSGATDGNVSNCRFTHHLTGAIDLGSLGGGGGGYQIHDCHFSTGNDAYHIYGSGGFLICSDNYFDTTGPDSSSYHIEMDANGKITGNHFKNSGGGGPPAPIFCSSSGGRKVVVTGNTTMAGSNFRGLVQMAGTTGQWVVSSNQLDNTGSGGVLGAVINSSATAELRTQKQTYAVQTANVTESANSLTNLTGLSFPVVAGRTYISRWYPIYSASATTTGAQFAFTGPTMTLQTVTALIPNTTSGTGAMFVANNNSMYAPVIMSGNATPSAGGDDYVAQITAVFTPSASGTVQLRGRTEVSGSGVTFQAGGTAELIDVGYEDLQQFSELNIQNDIS